MTLFGLDITEYAIAVAWIAGGFVLGFLTEKLVAGRLRAIARRRSWPGWAIVADGLGHMPVWWLGLLGAAIALDTRSLGAHVTRYGDKALVLLVGITVTIAVARISVGFARHYSASAEGPLPSTSIFVNLARIVIFSVGTLVVLSALGVQIGPLLAALGVGGIALALALQDTLGNLFAGIQIALGKQLHPGDYIELSSGQAGYVEDITWRYTTIRRVSNNLVVVPNATLATTIFTNYQLPAEELSVPLEVGVAYGTDLEAAERIAKEVAVETVAECSPSVAEYEPIARFNAFGDSAIQMTVILRSAEFTDQWELRHQFIKRLKKRFDEAGIEIPFPQRVVHTPEA